MIEFESLPLHDSIISLININWANRQVDIKLKAFTEKRNDAIEHVLRFDNVSNIEIPHHSPWGDSNQVNRALIDTGDYKLEMQSGDTIQISASGFRFEKTDL